MGIRKALAYISAHLDSWKAAAAKWTADKHPRYPKGHPKAGKFMPKNKGAEGGSEGSSGKSTAPSKAKVKVQPVKVKTKYGTFDAHRTKLDNGADVVAFQGPNKKWYVVDLKTKKALPLGDKEPKSAQGALDTANRQTGNVKRSEQQSKSATKPKPKLAEIPDSAGFKSLRGAKKWIQEHLATHVEFGNRKLADVNRILATMRMIEDKNDNLPKIDHLDLSATPRPSAFLGGQCAAGYYIGAGTGNRRIECASNVGTAEGNKEESLAGKIAKLKNIIEYQNKSLQHPNAQVWRKDIIADTEKQIRKLERGKGPSVSSEAVSGGGAEGVVTHEWGHAWHDRNRGEVEEKLGIKWSSEPAPKDYSTTQYSKSNHIECFAEAFTLYHRGRADVLHSDIVKFFDKQFPKLNYGGTA